MRDEIGGRDESPHGMAPSYESLASDRFAGSSRHFRLIVKLELVRCNGVPQFTEHSETFAVIVVIALMVRANRRTRLFCAVEGKICVLQQFGGTASARISR